MDTPTIRVSEIFGPTLQGEGAMLGKPTLFVRTGGCDYRCVWCDTPFAVNSAYRSDWAKMTAEDILDRCRQLAPPPYWITLSGGNPAIHPLKHLISEGQRLGYRFAMETQGSVVKPWFANLDHLVLSPKPPSSEMAFDEGALKEAIRTAPDDTVLKFVVFDESDFDWAYNLAMRYPEIPCFLQPGNPNISTPANTDNLLKKLEWLGTMCFDRSWHDVTVLPQLHVLIWNNERGR